MPQVTDESLMDQARRLALRAPHLGPPPPRRRLRFDQMGHMSQGEVREVSVGESNFHRLVDQFVNDQTTGMQLLAFVPHNVPTQAPLWPSPSLPTTLPELARDSDTNGMSGKTHSNGSDAFNSFSPSSAGLEYYDPPSDSQWTHDGILFIPQAGEANTTAVYTSVGLQDASTYDPSHNHANHRYAPNNDQLRNTYQSSPVTLLNTATSYILPDPEISSLFDYSVAQISGPQCDGTTTVTTPGFDGQQPLLPSVDQVWELSTFDVVQAEEAFIMPETDCPDCGTLLPMSDATCFVCMDEEGKC
jgi:hypothetical protein